MSFENNTKVRMTHFGISVAVNAIDIIRNRHILQNVFKGPRHTMSILLKLIMQGEA